MTRIKLILPIVPALFLGACSSTSTSPVLGQIIAAANIGCTVDGTFQPLAAAVLGQIPQTAGITSVDQILVHPIIQAACAALGKTATPAVQIKPPVATGPTATPAAAPPCLVVPTARRHRDA